MLLQGRHRGGAEEGSRGPWPVQPWPRGHLAEHLVPVEDGLALLLYLQLPALLGALHALQDRVGARPPEGGRGGSRGASVLQEEGRDTWVCEPNVDKCPRAAPPCELSGQAARAPQSRAALEGTLLPKAATLGARCLWKQDGPVITWPLQSGPRRHHTGLFLTLKRKRALALGRHVVSAEAQELMHRHGQQGLQVGAGAPWTAGDAEDLPGRDAPPGAPPGLGQLSPFPSPSLPELLVVKGASALITTSVPLKLGCAFPQDPNLVFGGLRAQGQAHPPWGFPPSSPASHLLPPVS